VEDDLFIIRIRIIIIIIIINFYDPRITRSAEHIWFKSGVRAHINPGRIG
jgi:hypothetical protein